MISRERHVLLAASMALALIAVPTVAMAVVVVPDWSEKVLPYFMLMLLPGFFFASVTGSNVHDDSRLVVCASSFLFWFGVAYGAIAVVIRVRRRSTNSAA